MTSEIQRVAIIGAGALGGMYGAKLLDMDAAAVSFVAGGDRGRRLKKSGLTVNDRHYRPLVTDPEAPVDAADLVIVAVKHDQLPAAIDDLRNIVGPDTALISVMNGIDSEDRLGAAYGMDRVLYAVALGMDALREENRIRYTRIGKLLFGRAQNRGADGAVQRLQAFLDRAGIPWEVPENMLRALWWKYMINVGINQASAVMGAPFGVFQTSREACGVMETAMREVMAIAGQRGIDLGEADIQNWYTVLASLSPKGKTSMLQDIEAGRKTEVEMFGGRIVEIGAACGVPTPVNRTLLKIIRVLEQRGSLASAQ